MATELRLRRGTTAQHGSFTGAAAEVTVDTTDNRLVVHDGATAGGHRAAKESEVLKKTGNLSELSDPAAARQNLQLKTAAQADLTTSKTDATVGRVLKVGDAGILVGQNAAALNLNSLVAPGAYLAIPGTGAAGYPAGETEGIVSIAAGTSGAVNNKVAQRWAGLTTGKEFRRVSIDAGTSWTGWLENLNSGQFKTAAFADLTTSDIDQTVGRVLKVGDHGVGTAAPLTGDLNNVRGSAPFQFTNSAANAPSTGNAYEGAGIQVQGSANTKLQLLSLDATRELYIRRYTGASWGAPHLVYTADNLDTAPEVADTGWASLTLQNSFANVSAHPLQRRKIGKMAFVNGSVTRSSLPIGIVLTTLPVGYRPQRDFHYVVSAAGANLHRIAYVLLVDSDGLVTVVWSAAAETGAATNPVTFNINLSFPVA